MRRSAVAESVVAERVDVMHGPAAARVAEVRKAAGAERRVKSPFLVM
ncbi:UNVERIFIED_ORG: hypothetical protein CLV66_104250 [Actinomadura viridilutea]|nr:hypothetical protein [Actinomadura rubrobrunea]